MSGLEKRVKNCFGSKEHSDKVVGILKRLEAEYKDIRSFKELKYLEKLLRGVDLDRMEDALALYVLGIRTEVEESRWDELELDERKRDRHVNLSDMVESIIRAAHVCKDKGLPVLRRHAEAYVRNLIGGRALPYIFVRHYASAFNASDSRQQILLDDTVEYLLTVPHSGLTSDHACINIMHHWPTLVGMKGAFPIWLDLLREVGGRERMLSYIKMGYQLAATDDKGKARKALGRMSDDKRLLVAPVISGKYLTSDDADEFIRITQKLSDAELKSWEALHDSEWNLKRKKVDIQPELYAAARARLKGDTAVRMTTLKEVIGDIIYTDPEVVDVAISAVTSGRATDTGLRLAKRYRRKPEFASRIRLLSAFSSIEMSDEHREAWIKAFDAIYRERGALCATRPDDDESYRFKAEDDVLLEKIRGVDASKMGIAVEGVVALTNRGGIKEASLEKMVGEVTIASTESRLASTIATDVLGYSDDRYSAEILSNSRVIAQRITASQWRRAWKAIRCMRDEKTGAKKVLDPVKIANKTAFVKNLCSALQMESGNIDFLLDELPSKSVYNVGPYAVIVASAIKYDGLIDNADLKRMNRIIRASEGNYEDMQPLFETVLDGLCGTERASRSRVIDGLERVFAEFHESNGKENLEVACEFIDAAKRALTLYSDRFDEWVAQGVAHAGSKKDILQFLRDKDDYFTSRMESLIDGLRLSEVSQRLLTYVQALTGSDIEIKASDDDSLACRLEGNTFYLPSRVRISSNNDDNYRIYRALASYQAGAVEFGTYSGDVAGFLSGLENKELALRILETIELARIGAQLRVKYAGLRKDLVFCDSALLERIPQTGAQASKMVRSMRAKVHGGSCEEGLAGIIDRARSGSSIESSFDLAREAYALIAPNWQDEEQEDIEKDSVLSINTAINATGKGGVDFLVAGPQEKPAERSRFLYDEWDGERYVKQHVQVFELALPLRQSAQVQAFLEKNRAVIDRLKRDFEACKPEGTRVRKRQLSGEVDIDRLIEAQAEIKMGITPSEKIFMRTYKDERSVAALLAADLSGSLRNFTDLKKPDKRLIDLIRESKMYISEALDALGDSFALCAVSGETEKRVEFYIIKEFDARYDAAVRASIGSLMPMKQNRDGAGIRHATAKLRSRPERVKWLFYLMEGIPRDHGYEGKRAIEDTKRACLEARQHGCLPVVICYGKPDKSLKEIGDVAVYREIQDAAKLPEVLPRLYQQLTV